MNKEELTDLGYWFLSICILVTSGFISVMIIASLIYWIMY